MRAALGAAALGLVLAACGESAEPDRFDLRTPGAETGAPLTPTPEATATPRANGNAGTHAEARRRHACRTADRPRMVGRACDAGTSRPRRATSACPRWPSILIPAFLATASDVKAFNRDLPCGAKLEKMRRSAEPMFVVGIFRLTERPGSKAGCGTGTGNRAAVAFRIYRGHITTWIRADEELATPTPTPKAGPSATPEDSTSA